MASFFGSVATEVGKGIKENSANMREDRLKAEDYAREQQLAKQRMTHETSTLERQLTANSRQQTRMIEANKLMEENRQASEADYRDKDREAETDYRDKDRKADVLRAAMQEENANWRAALQAYAQHTNKSSISGGGWSRDFDFQTEGRIVDGELSSYRWANVTGPDGTARELSDGKITRVGQVKTPKTFPTPDLQKRAHDDLISGKISPAVFEAEYAYIPEEYAMGKMTTGADGFPEFIEKRGIIVQGFDRYMQTSDDRRAVRGNVEMVPMPKQPAAVEGGPLAQGQAGAGELPDSLETGGQLDQPEPTPAPAAEPGLPPTELPTPSTYNGGHPLADWIDELDDTGAADVSNSIGAAFSRIGSSKHLLTPYGR